MTFEETVKQTLEYARRYGQELSREQLYERLMGSMVIERSDFKSKVLGMKVEVVARNMQNFRRKMMKAQRLAEEIGGMFKDILFIGVTGSVAAENPGKNDDIDLMIITKSDRLWISRLMLRLYIFIKRIPHRKYGQRQKKDEFCFNLWLDETALRLPEIKQTERNAIDLILMKPLLNHEQTYERLIRENKWAKKFVATPYENKLSVVRNQSSEKRRCVNEVGLMGFIGRITNFLVYWPQRWWMRWKIVKEVVDEHRAFFHKS